MPVISMNECVRVTVVFTETQKGCSVLWLVSLLQLFPILLSLKFSLLPVTLSPVFREFGKRHKRITGDDEDETGR